MLNNLADKLTVLDKSTELFRQRALLVVVLLLDWRKVDVDARALAGVDLGVHAVF